MFSSCEIPLCSGTEPEGQRIESLLLEEEEGLDCVLFFHPIPVKETISVLNGA